MPENLALYVLLVLALGIGFLLGRRERRRRARDPGIVAQDYFRGLNHLLNERHVLAIETFVEAMAVDNDTVDTHLALGSLVRRRGEVDKAIRIHQNLLARPVLSGDHRAQTELELARDYLAAGLLGRAENLLLELTRKNGDGRQVAREMLLEIYQRERDWEHAVAVGQELARKDRAVRTPLAHFQCELAENALAENDLRSARAELAKAADFDADCARVKLVGAKVEFAANRYREVKRLLRKARSQDPEIAGQTLELFRTACDELGDESDYIDYLRECLDSAPLLQVIGALGEHVERDQGPEAARTFVMEQLLRNPSLGGFVTLLEHLDREGEPLQAEQLQLVRRFSQSLLHKQPSYRCDNCGFSGQTLIWQCPSCRTWGAIKPVVRYDRDL
ncbi:MAG: lipopolysaccharide assembly protein LapB [Gammaproteobacteria bacterium]|nr:lipopolysaccharide assembly protein LapB [Gammaproteobacteria bacterium]